MGAVDFYCSDLPNPALWIAKAFCHWKAKCLYSITKKEKISSTLAVFLGTVTDIAYNFAEIVC